MHRSLNASSPLLTVIIIANPANMFWELANMRYSAQVTQGSLGSLPLSITDNRSSAANILDVILDFQYLKAMKR